MVNVSRSSPTGAFSSAELSLSLSDPLLHIVTCQCHKRLQQQQHGADSLCFVVQTPTNSNVSSSCSSGSLSRVQADRC